MALVISFLITFWVAYLIYKKYKPQPVLVVGGFILMYTAVIFGYGQILAPKASTGSILFDTFQFMSQTLSSRAAKLGLNIMCVGAFAKYMDKIGASRALVRMTIKPLLKLKSPYLVLALSWVLGLCIGLCINSASGLAMLLMVTVFPILIGLGVSRLAATAAVASTLCFDWSPSDTGTILSAETAGMNPVIYWTNYQVPIVIVSFFVVGALFYFSQKYLDKRDGHVVVPMDVSEHTDSKDPADGGYQHPDQRQPERRFPAHDDDDRHGSHHFRFFHRYGFRQRPLLRLCRPDPGCCPGKRYRAGTLPAAHALRGIHRTYMFPYYRGNRCIFRHG